MAITNTTPEQAKHDAEIADALIVCAYDNEQKCRKNRIAGALTLGELRDRESDLSMQRPLIFYCG